MSKFVPNSFQVPNAFVDEVLSKISDAACKLYLVICRKTRGWNKEMDSISLSQFEGMNMKSNLAQKIEQDNEIHIHPSTLKKLERQAMSKKEEGHTRTPNTLIDDQIMAQLKDKAFKCLMFIVRQTIGFNRPSHTIAITQFQKYCGIKKRDTVMSCISELEEANLIKVTRKTGCLNEYFLTLDQYQQSGLVPTMDSSPNKQDGTSTFNGDGTSTVKRDTIKETFKENIKETHTGEKAPEIFDQDDSWKPNPNFLKTILLQTKFSNRADEIISLPDFDFHLGNFNAHWENKIDLTENQKTRKFAAWLVQEFEKQLAKTARAEKQKASYQPASSKNSQTMKAHDEFFAQHGIGSNFESDFIDVHATEIKTIGGSNQ